ncbi:hypothetical protein EIP91_008600 [Steccherinum ochraceum]|uniref:Uncharacterized protein n=1 Tax=Steccherinum ochraceum TaxID=92696 RepID=A0A4R0S076_9APHY|nr:hypothetical protein EIP91_008600 [Steccherinum ochraceum]
MKPSADLLADASPSTVQWWNSLSDGERQVLAAIGRPEDLNPVPGAIKRTFSFKTSDQCTWLAALKPAPTEFGYQNSRYLNDRQMLVIHRTPSDIALFNYGQTPWKVIVFTEIPGGPISPLGPQPPALPRLGTIYNGPSASSEIFPDPSGIAGTNENIPSMYPLGTPGVQFLILDRETHEALYILTWGLRLYPVNALF